MTDRSSLAKHSPSAPVPDPAPLRIRGPADLVALAPFLLGFHPAESLVMIGLDDSRVVVTVRIDLDDLVTAESGDGGCPEVLRSTVAAMSRGGASRLAGIVFDNRATSSASAALPWLGLRAAVRTEADRTGVAVADLILVRGGRFWSYECDDAGCCPPEGRELAEADSVVSAEATYAGMVALPDRDAVAALLDPLPMATRCVLRPFIAAHERAAVRAVVSGGGQRALRSVKRAIFRAARSADAIGPVGLPADDAARFGAALSGIDLRDAVWVAIDDARLDGRELWRELGRRLPPPYDAAALFLFGWASWRAGNGALARIAAERAVDSDPGYSAADLLLAALSRGLDPRSVPKLRTPRSA